MFDTDRSDVRDRQIDSDNASAATSTAPGARGHDRSNPVRAEGGSLLQTPCLPRNEVTSPPSLASFRLTPVFLRRPHKAIVFLEALAGELKEVTRSRLCEFSQPKSPPPHDLWFKVACPWNRKKRVTKRLVSSDYRENGRPVSDKIDRE